MYDRKDNLRNYHSYSKVNHSQYNKSYILDSARQNSQIGGAFNNFALKKKSKSDININLGATSYRSIINNLNFSSLKQKSFNVRTEKSQFQEEKQKSIGKNLEKYKIKKIQQRINDSAFNQKGKYDFPESPSSRYMRSSSSTKKVLSARKPSDVKKDPNVPNNKVYLDTKKQTNLEIDTSNLSEFFQNKKLQTHIPQTTKSIMQYNKVIKKNQMTLKPFEESKHIFKKSRQVQIAQEVKQEKRNKREEQTPITLAHYQMKTTLNQKDKMSAKTSKGIEITINQSAITTKYKKPIQPLSIEDFIKWRQLGKGQNGKIYAAFHKKTGAIVALKHFQQSKIVIDHLIDQMKIQLFSIHKNILAAYGYIIQKQYGLESGVWMTQRKNSKSCYNIYFIMEKGECNLFSLIKKERQLSEEDTAVFTEQILNGLKYLHQNKIIHRDLKPQNIIISHGQCKITDFGWSVIGSEQRQTFCGTLQYVSPQVANGSRYDNKIDVWSVGVLIFEMLTGEAPYDTSKILKNPKDQYRKRILSRLPQTVSYECKQLLSKLLKIDPKRRISIDQALNHRWIKDSITRKTLRKDASIVKQELQKLLNRP